MVDISLKQKLVTEMIGTLALVYVAGLTSLQADSDNLDLVGVAIANTMLLSIIIYFGYRFSGAHYNPAVTLSLLVTNRIEQKEAIQYVGAQLLGSILGGILLLATAGEYLLARARGKSTLGFPHVMQTYPFLQAILLEMVITFILVFVIWAVAVDKKAPSHIYGLAIGGTVGFNILAAGPLTGAAMNPARVFGPALLTFDFSSHLVYWIGPLLGGVLAGIFYQHFYLDEIE
ncbi:MAG: aquaporin [Candidatus Heimdallarchaeota archaeon]|nr:aquaporin [Candidatus Heimdallarchaeota archaeon]